jgi:predicted lipoprotein
MMFRSALFFILGSAMLVASSGCTDNTPDQPSGSTFEREDMLRETAQNVIIPAYSSFKADLGQLSSDFAQFESSPSQSNFEVLRNSFLQAYQSWQPCSPIEIGPAAEQSLRFSVNTFPLDTAQVNSNLSTGWDNLYSAQNNDAKGLPALDYLLFISDDFNLFTQDSRIQYFKDNLDLVTEKLDIVYNAWNNGYAEEFAVNSGTDVGSSLGLMVNELNFDFELIKNAKVAIPLGLKTLGVAQPETVEALYSDASKDLLIQNLKGVKNLFVAGEGTGIDDYLDNLGAKYGSENLSNAIIARFESCEAKAASLGPSLKSQIENKPSEVEALHSELQNLVVLLKTDMPSQLGVQITYQDNDGD